MNGLRETNRARPEEPAPLPAPPADGGDMGQTREVAPAPDEIREASVLLKTVGDLTRMRLLCALLREGQLSVGGLQDALAMSQSAVSHQLRVLRDARLVRFERAGKTVRYSLADDHVRDLLLVVLEHARHD